MQDSATITALVAEGKVRVLAAVYDITTGVVTFDDAA
jgi:hypothetical protein